ncbi:MAG TPA: DUF1579 domain-containing protein [Verrucomicrobiae bacterium]|nr:DUF1579 domain-containing protein [Verrucomicrobiae bacterium]
MKRSIYCSGGALVVAAVFLAGLALADNKNPAADAKKADGGHDMAAAIAPGAKHKALEPFVGEWNAEVKAWMAPGQPPTESKGTAKATWILDGRYVQEEFSGDFMGQPFRGMSLTGYDNVRGKYRGVWIDNMSTTIVTSEGDFDAANKTLTCNGDYACAMTGDKNKQARMITRIVSKDKHVFEMHDPSLGANSKVMEITYTRK